MSAEVAMTLWGLGACLLLALGLVFMCVVGSNDEAKFPRWWFWLAGIWIAPVALHAWFIVVWLFLKVG